MADKAHDWTDEKLEEMEERLSAIYSRSMDEIQQKADDYFAQFAADDAKKRKLLADGKITQKDYDKWRKAEIMRGTRFSELKAQVAEQLLHVNETALAYINGELPEVYSVNYNSLADSVDGVGGYSFTLLDADTVKNLATEDGSLLPYKEIDPAKDIPWNTKKINAEVLQGVLQGESMDKIADRMQNVQAMNREQAIRTARTIVTSAENKGRQDSYKRAQDDGIIMDRRWIATHDARTRDWHRDLDGIEVGVDEPWENDFGDIMFPGDPSAHPANVYNCRCSMRAVVKGFGNVRIRQDTFVGNSGGVQFLGLKQSASLSSSSAGSKSTSTKQKKEIKTDYTAKQLESKSRAELVRIAREVARKNASRNGISEEEALRRFDLLVASNTTPQMRKYIKRYGGK